MKRAKTKEYEEKMAIRPPFNENISISDFKEFYWWDSELKEFCQQHHLVSSDRKLDKQARILRYLQGLATPSDYCSTSNKKRSYKVLSTGDKKRSYNDLSAQKTVQKKIRLENSDAEPTLDTVIREDFKFNQKNRDFFLREIGDHFKFTAHIGAYVRNNFGKITYRDFIKEWNNDLARRKAGYKPPIMASCRYNQFIRDYLADNKGASFRDAVAAWTKVRDIRGDQRYKK